MIVLTRLFVSRYEPVTGCFEKGHITAVSKWSVKFMNSLLRSLPDWVSLLLEGLSLLGYFALTIGKELLNFRRSVMPSSSKDPRRDIKIKAILSFETSISIYQSTRRDSPEDLKLHHLRGNIQSRSTTVMRNPTKEMMKMTTCHKRRVSCEAG